MKWFAIVLVLVGFNSLGADTVALEYGIKSEVVAYLSNVVAIADCDQPNCERIDYVVDGQTNTFHNWGRIFTVKRFTDNGGKDWVSIVGWATNSIESVVVVSNQTSLYRFTNRPPSVVGKDIQTLAQDGTLCRALGHAWVPHVHVTLEWAPDRIGCRICNICKAHQDRTASWTQ